MTPLRSGLSPLQQLALTTVAVLLLGPCSGDVAACPLAATAGDEVSLMQHASHVTKRPQEPSGVYSAVLLANGTADFAANLSALGKAAGATSALGVSPAEVEPVKARLLTQRAGGVNHTSVGTLSLFARWQGLGHSPVLCPAAFVFVGSVSFALIATAALSKSAGGYHEKLEDEDIQRVFMTIDKDGSGTLSFQEVQAFIKSSGHAIPENQISAIMRMADKDDSGDLDCEEFRLLLRSLGDEQPRDLRRCLLAEFVGMFLNQFFGGMPDTGPVGNALICVALLYMFAPISGAHFNPAVTVAAWMSRQVTIKKALYYLAINMLAAVEGALLLQWIGIHQISSVNGVAVNPCLAPAAGVPAWEVLVLETLSTFTFIMVFLAVAVDAKCGWGNAGPLALGITLIGLSMACTKISGLSMNPARFLAPCIAYGCFPTFWETVCYILAAFVAAALAASLYLAVFLDRPTPEQHEGMSNFQFMISDHSSLKRMLASTRRNSRQVSSGMSSVPSALGAQRPETSPERRFSIFTPKGGL